MKSLKFTFLFFALISFTGLCAQDAQGCDGQRYIDDVFTDVTMTTVQYGQNNNLAGTNLNLMMDVYEPVGDTQEKRPVIIFAFGGSYILGQRSDMADFCIAYAKKGYVTATIDYRLWPFSLGLPTGETILDVVVQSVGDMKASIRHFRKDAATDNIFKADPNYIFVGGLSAGAITALHTADLDESDNIPQFIIDSIDENGGIDGDSGDADNATYSSDVQGVINLSGGLHIKEWIDENSAPFISMHGDTDGTVPCGEGLANGFLNINGSCNLHPQADLIGIPNYFVEVPGGGHTDIYTDTQFAPYYTEFIENGNLFLENLLCGNSVNVKEVDASKYIATFPNPSSSEMTVQLIDIQGAYDVLVFDQLGRLVQSAYGQTDAQFILERKILGSGLFNLTLITSEGELLNSKVIFE